VTLAVLAVGCGLAAADATTGPAGWATMHVDDPAVVGAWAEPARGCYAAVIDVQGAAAGEQLVTELAKQGVAAHDVVTSDAAVTFAFARAPYHGRAQASFGEHGVTATVCFWNEREPASCAAACSRWMK
jgi:hypothetical protein